MPYRLTKAQMKEEIRKCGRDPVYFIKNYCQIQHPQKGLIPFHIYDFQEDLLKDFNDYKFNIILKARQLGISTITAAYVVWMMLFRREKNVLVVATKFSTAANLVKKVKKMFKHVPAWLRIADIEINNETAFTLTNGSQIKASSTSSDAGRSEALSLLVIDEAAHVDGLDEMWMAIGPTLALGGRCIALSCVTKDTFVFTDKGIKTIDDFIPNEGKVGDYQIEEYSVLGKGKVRDGNLFHNNGKVKTRKIFTANAYLEGSENHKLWAFKDGKYDWYKLEDLSETDFVSVQYGNDIWGNNDDVSDFKPEITPNHKNIFTPDKISPDIAYVLGMYIAEGSVYESKNHLGATIGGMTTFTCGDDLTEILENIGLSVSKSDNFHHCCSSKTFVEFLKYLGFNVDARAPEKIIPSRLLEMSRENIRALLQGIFDGDGFSRKDRGEVGIGLSSLRLIEQIRVILNNFGILSEYSEYITPSTEKVKVSSLQYRLNLSKRDSKKFYEEIGFRFERKQINENVLKKSNLVRADSKDIIPGFLNHMKNMFEFYPKGTWTLNKESGLNINGILNQRKTYKTQNISRQNALKMFEVTRKHLPDWYIEELEKILSPSLKWVQISKIEEGEAETFDFSLPNDEEDFWDHSVVYNSILGHQTPNGVGNWFHKNYVDAVDKKNDFHPVELMWNVHPDRDQEWFEEQKRKYSPRELAQEFECNFNMSGDTVIDPKIIQKLKKKAREPEFRTGWDRNYWIWENPLPGHSYLISADVARGDGADYSTFHVLKLETLELVAEYQGKPKPEDFAKMLYNVGMEYGKAMVVPENNTYGFSVCQKLVEMEYPNLYYSLKSSHEYVSQNEVQYKSGTIPGFSTTPKTRPIIVAKLEEFFRNNLITTYSTRLIHELERFVWSDTGKPEAMKGSNDDLIMALAIACWVRDTALHKSARDVAYSKAMLGAIIQSNTRMSTAIPGMSGYSRKLDFDQTNMKEVKEQHRKFNWLYKG